VAAAIDPDQPLPIYVQLKTLLLEEIIGGRYGSGGQLPTEHELCAQYGISRTPVHRALAELAEDGAIFRHRRRGTFVNPHWVQHNSSRAELRIVVPEGPWEALVRDACPAEATLNLATVALDDLHQVLIHAVAEGRAPDLALLDSVWVPEFAASGFLLPLDELDAEWLDTEYLADVLDPFVRANQFEERTVAVQAEADVAGLWYRRDVLAAAGIDPPQTWADLVNAGQVLLRMGIEQPLALPAGSRGGETTTYCLLGIQAANCAAVIDGDEVVLDSPRTVECLTFLHDLVDVGVLSVDAVSYEHDRAPRMLARSQTALSIGGSYEMRTLAAEAGLDVDDVWRHFGFVPTRLSAQGPVLLPAHHHDDRASPDHPDSAPAVVPDAQPDR
jgi:multiple sugar transport system substrate-binding protein